MRLRNTLEELRLCLHVLLSAEERDHGYVAVSMETNR
jgi:hypothetical protein